MKKTYINPTLDVIEIRTNVRMLAGSETQGYQGDYDPGTTNIGAPTDDFDDYDFDDFE